MNFKSLFLSIILAATAFSTIPAAALNSQFATWANKAVVPHIKEGSKALGADLKNLGNAAALIAKQSLDAGRLLPMQVFKAVNNAIDMFPVPALLVGIYIPMTAAACAETVHQMRAHNQLLQLNNLYWLVQSCPSAANLKTVQIYHPVQEVNHFSPTVKDAFAMFEAVADARETLPEAYALAQKKLIQALEIDIAQVKKNTVANCIGFTGLGITAAVAGFKIGKTLFTQKS